MPDYTDWKHGLREIILPIWNCTLHNTQMFYLNEGAHLKGNHKLQWEFLIEQKEKAI